MPAVAPGSGSGGQCSGPGGIGPVYNFAQLEGLWINAGGSRVTAPVAAAIGLAESKGCAVAQNPDDNGGTQTSWGIWQISDGTHNMPVPNIYDPAVNAQAAVAKYDAKGNFTDWGTFTSGAYKAFLSGGTPDLNVPSPPGPSNAGGASSGATDQSTCVLNVIPGVTGVWGGWCPFSKIDARVGLAVTIILGSAIVGLEGARIWASREGLSGGGARGPVGRAVRDVVTAAAPETKVVSKGARSLGGAVTGRRAAAGRREEHELRQRGASELSAARRPIRQEIRSGQRAPVRAGRRTGSYTPEGRPAPRRETGRQRAARTASTGRRPATRAEAGF